MLGLFYPARYGIKEYKDWDINRIGKNHREFLILLNRDGEGSASLQLYFNGASNYFRELPQKPELGIYNKIDQYKRETI
jgi:hypothetical protein